jgi:integrase
MARRRRASGEGGFHFWKDKGLWVGRITLPDGKKRAKYSKSQQVVKDWLLAERNKLKQGIFVRDDKMTVATFLERYLEDHVKRTLQITTYESYKDVIERNILPTLGAAKLTNLRPEQINHLLAEEIRRGRSERHAQYLHAILKSSLNMAVKWELIPKNPAAVVGKPKVNFQPPRIWGKGDINTFISHVKQDRWSGIYHLATLGIRKGEILGLPLWALNLEEGYLMVVQNLQYVQGQGTVLLEPKTEKSRRRIVLPDFVKVALRAHLERRSELSGQPSWKESGLVFTTDIGTPVNPQNLLKHFKKKTKEAGLPKIKFHSMRHSCASYLLSQNVHPKIVQELLGHSTVELTLNQYSHINNPLNTVASDALSKLVST